MEQKEAVLLLTTLHCIQETKESGHDEVYMLIYGDGKLIGRYPTGSSGYSMHSDEDASVDVEIKCTYFNEISIDFWECDDYHNNTTPDSEDDHIGWVYIKRGDEWDEDNSGSRTVIRDDDPGEYKIDFRIITDPIPTVRLLGIYCETQSAGMNVNLVEAIASVAEDCTKAAGKVLKKSPRPSRKLIGDAFIAASKVLKGIVEFAELIAHLIEGDDDVYMRHIADTETRGVGGSFFPPDKEVYKMTEGTEIHFEEEYGKYFRFPLDTGPVTIELREYDAAKYDIIVGSIIIDPEQISNNTSQGIGGGSPPTDEDVAPIEGGMAVFDGPAVVEIANSYYGRHNGEGAVYHVCYSVGMEDWCKPATTEGQADPNDEEAPQEVHGYFTAPRGPVDLNFAIEGCKEQNGVLPTVEEMSALVAQGLIPDSWPKGNYWLAEHYYINIETGSFNSAASGAETYFYSCKQADREDGVEGWDGVYGFTFSSPEGLIAYAVATEGCTSKGGELPTADAMRKLIQEGKIPGSWPKGPYWLSGQSYMNLPEGTITESADGSELCFYTCQIEGLNEDKIEAWEGIGGLYTFPLGPGNATSAAEGTAFQRGELPSIEQLRVLIQQGMIPDSWPADAYYWTADNRWVDITDIYNAGTSANGSELYYYTCIIEALADGVESLESIEYGERLYVPPRELLSHSEATAVCEARGGELPTLEALRLLVEQGKIPESWPRDAYYYTIERYMVNINAVDSSDDIVMSADGRHSCYYSCELEPERTQEVHGFFTAPQYVVDLDAANRGCAGQGGALPSLEELLLLIEQGRIRDSWPKGEYWAGASANTPFRVNIEDGSYSYSTNGAQLCYYSCKIEDEADGVAEWEPGDGYLTFPPEERLNFEDATAACEAMGGELPSLAQMQTLIKEGRIPNTWPANPCWYITSDNRLIDITDWEHEGTPETTYYYSCKLPSNVSRIESGDEMEREGRLYTHPQGPVDHTHATDGSFYQGGVLPNLEELRLMVEQGLIPDTWPTDCRYYTREKYMVRIDTVNTTVELSEDGSDLCYYTCKIQQEPVDQEVHGFFKSPLLQVVKSNLDDYLAIQGALPTLEEMLLLIAQGRIPDTWPTDCTYWVGASAETLFKVDIKTGAYYFQNEYYDGECYYTYKIESEADGMEEWTGVDAFYMLPGEPQDYATARQACLDQRGKLPSVEVLQKLIRQGKIPESWPTGYYWTSGSYYMNIADGTFKYSLSGFQSCYYTCRIAGARGVAQGDEVKIDEVLYMSPAGPLKRDDAKNFCDYQGGKFPTLEEMQYLIDEGLVPDTWPTDKPYLTSTGHWVDITNSANTEYDSDGLVPGYYTCKVVLGQQEEEASD